MQASGALSSLTLSETTPRASSSDRAIALWLFACCAMIFLMVVIGGITRLTESGLSITEWQPVTGALPPMSEAQWTAEFEKYKAIPQYRAIHADMTLGQFKYIFFWEYFHRLWGRLIGVVFAVPFAYFLMRGRVSRRLAPRLVLLFVLGGLQGALGWYMVESGLSERIEVSQYRLAAHLAAAALIYAAILWVALELIWPEREAARDPRQKRLRAGVGLVLAFISLTLVAGAFVAGLRAGYIYNTFPLMGDRLLPAEYGALSPWWRNWFENAAAVQFNHRLLAEITVGEVVGLWLFSLRFGLGQRSRAAMNGLFAMALLQFALGISTLLLVVPLPLAVAHQAGAMLLLTAAVVTFHALRLPRVDVARVPAL
jgi:heme a synthase